jgi:hypothetical protein
MTENVTRYWFDTEFMEDGRTIDLISIGVVDDNGREFYAENQTVDYRKANTWVQHMVLPHLWNRQPEKRKGNEWSRDGGVGGYLTHQDIASKLFSFVAQGPGQPEFWAYYGDYDWVALCQLYGRMVDLPQGWPMFAMDLKQLAVSLGDPELPEQTEMKHHALGDARWTKSTWEFLQKKKEDTLFIKMSRPVHISIESAELYELYNKNSGICPMCESPIIDHDDAERKRCHDLASGFIRKEADD